MKCLVTGNHGYIGHIIVHELLKEDYEVIGLDCDFFPSECFGREDAFKSKQRVKTQVTKDIRDVNVKDLKGIDSIIHLAALPNDWACDLAPNATEDINHLATLQLAITAKRAKVKRFIFASSCSVYGVKGEDIINEEDRLSPITPYGFSKLKAENALKDMDSKDFTVTCMRNATCYGVSPRMRFDMVLNNLVGWAYTTGVVNMHLSDGTAWRPLVHIEDVAKAYIHALKAPKEDIKSGTFSVVGENFQIKDIAEIVKAHVPGSEVKYAPGAPKDWRSYNVSRSKIEKMLGFIPVWDVERGVQELYLAYKNFGLTETDFKNIPNFWAGKYFKKMIESGKFDQYMRKKDN